MSEHAEALSARQAAINHTANTVTALATAGMCLLHARGYTPVAGQELIDAMREDIKQMIGDVEALQSVIRGG